MNVRIKKRLLPLTKIKVLFHSEWVS